MESSGAQSQAGPSSDLHSCGVQALLHAGSRCPSNVVSSGLVIHGNSFRMLLAREPERE